MMSKPKSWNPLLKSYPDSEKINNVSFEAETLFTRLIAKSDDNSNFYGSKKQVLGKLFAKRWELNQVSVKKIDRMLKELAGQNLIELYTVRGEIYLHIVNNPKCLRSDIKKVVEFPGYEKRDGRVTKTGRTRNENGNTEQEQEQEQEQKKPPTPLKRGEEKKGKTEFPEKLDTPEFRNTWELWTQFRRESKKPLTPSTVKMQLKKLSSYSVDIAIEMISQSITHGWQGLFEVKNNGSQRPTSNRNYSQQKSNIGETVEV